MLSLDVVYPYPEIAGGWEDRFGAALEKILLGAVGLSLIYCLILHKGVGLNPSLKSATERVVEQLLL